MRQGHTSRPCTAATCCAIELSPELSWLAADLTQQGVRLQLAVDAAFAPDNTGILVQEHMWLLWIPGVGVLVQTFQVPALLVKEGLVLLAPLGWGGPAETAGLNRHPEA